MSSSDCFGGKTHLSNANKTVRNNIFSHVNLSACMIDLQSFDYTFALAEGRQVRIGGNVNIYYRLGRRKVVL